MKKNRLIIIIVAAVVLAGIGFGAGVLVKSSVASNAQITADEAKQIALSSVGVTAEKASFTKAVYDEGIYEVDFYTESNEYDFEISADTGAIVEREVSPRDSSQFFDNNQQTGDSEPPSTEPSEKVVQQTQSTQAPTESATQSAAQSNNDDNVIGVDSAKSIALNHAGLSSASFTNAYLDYDDGIRVYDIEFTSGNKEYDYEIDAHTGNILDCDVDRLDYDD